MINKFYKAYLLLFLILFLRALLVFSTPVSDKLNGDAFDYVGKANHLITYGEFKKVTPPDLPTDIAGYYSDFRPPGFPVIISALIFAGGNSPNEINLSTKILNFFLDALTCIILFQLVLSKFRKNSTQYVAAAAIGLQPWTSSFVTATYPDTTVAFLVVTGVALLPRYVNGTSRAQEITSVFFASMALSIGALIRPELIVAPPVLIATALYLKFRRNDRFCKLAWIALIAIIPFLLSIALNMGYRWTVEKKLAVYGKFEHQTPGLNKWILTWIGSAKSKEDIMWGPFQISQKEFKNLPQSAFSDTKEKEILSEIAEKSRQRGYLTKAEDDVFREVAEKRIQEDPLTYWLYGRIYNSIHFWVNTGSASYLLHHQARLPALASKAITGTTLILKISFLTLSLYGFYISIKRTLFFDKNLKERPSPIYYFLAIGFIFFLMRTFIFGYYISFIEYRYSIPAWPFVVAAAVFGAITLMQSTKTPPISSDRSGC